MMLGRKKKEKEKEGVKTYMDGVEQTEQQPQPQQPPPQLQPQSYEQIPEAKEEPQPVALTLERGYIYFVDEYGRIASVKVV